MALREEKTVARARLAATPFFFALVLVKPEPSASATLLTVVGLVIAAYVVASGWLTLRRSPSRSATLVMIGLDLLALGVGAELAEASTSPYPFIALLGLCAMPTGISVRARLAFYVAFAVAVGGPLLQDEIDDGVTPAHTVCFVAGLGIAWTLATRGAHIERRRRERLDALVAERAVLLQETSELTERQRRGASHQLHDGVLQTLLAARQDLEEAATRSADPALERGRELVAHAAGTLRAAVAALHPVSLAGARLADALSSLAAQHREAGADVRLQAEQLERSEHDDALFVVVRELLVSMVACAPAAEVAVELRRADGRTVVELRQRCGCDAADAVGVAWARFRLESVGGSLERLAEAPGEVAFRVAVPVVEVAAAPVV